MGYYWTKLIYNCHYYCYPYLVLLLCLDFMDSLENRRDFIWCLPWAVTRYPRVQRLWKLIFCGEGAALSPGHFSTHRTLSLNQRNPRRIRRREKPFLTLKGYGTFMYICWSWYSPTCPAQGWQQRQGQLCIGMSVPNVCCYLMKNSRTEFLVRST